MALRAKMQGKSRRTPVERDFALFSLLCFAPLGETLHAKAQGSHAGFQGEGIPDGFVQGLDDPVPRVFLLCVKGLTLFIKSSIPFGMFRYPGRNLVWSVSGHADINRPPCHFARKSQEYVHGPVRTFSCC
ncbi:MAG: hypothetical protein QM786_08735 [Breznakibacter sp.]